MTVRQEIREFQQLVWQYYQAHGRAMPWRANPEPYWVVVSELMLQQTQVSRVLPQFEAFVAQFPDWQALAQAPLAAVLTAWQGLGYNRRARFLHEVAKTIVNRHAGRLPERYEELVQLPGIGPGTAGAILVYAYNKPVAFVETNIRTVFIHHFFPQQEKVSDRELVPLIQAALSSGDVRSWYWALMDYGAFLKSTGNRAARRSRHHTVQSTFEGSHRQLRGHILRILATRSQNQTQLAQLVADPRLDKALAQLESEGLISRKGSLYKLPT